MMSIFFLFSPVKFPKLRQTGSALSPGTLIANHAAANKIGTSPLQKLNIGANALSSNRFSPIKKQPKMPAGSGLTGKPSVSSKFADTLFIFPEHRSSHRYYKLSDFRGAKIKRIRVHRIYCIKKGLLQNSLTKNYA